MRSRIPLIAAACAAAAAFEALAVAPQRGAVRAVTWDDTAAVRSWLEGRGVTAATFPAYLERLRQSNAARVREGDLDHLVFYLLQSTHFTKLPPIEPAIIAKAFVESLDEQARAAFLRGAHRGPAELPPAVRARASALLRAIDSDDRDPRLMYFRELVSAALPRLRAPRSRLRSERSGGQAGGQAGRDDREAGLLREYVRVMRFVYEKEFVAQRSDQPSAAVAELYRTRGLSTDTAVEAGFLVHEALGVIRALEPLRRIRRVLIVGPGLDLAPRTSLDEAGPPQSYQPWAVMDALVALGLSSVDDLEIVAADINPRVVEHLIRQRTAPPSLTLVSEIRDSDSVTLSADFRQYFAELGKAIGRPAPPAIAASTPGHLQKTLRVNPAAARVLSAEALDIVTERLDERSFDLVVATNILPYFDDPQLALAMVNIASMLAPGAMFLHNEGRSSMGDLTSALGLPLEHSRHAIIATVRNAPPLADSIWLHRRVREPGGRGAGGAAARSSR